MRIEDLRNKKREEILKIAAKHGARNFGIFGSVARGEADSKSDLDNSSSSGYRRSFESSLG